MRYAARWVLEGSDKVVRVAKRGNLAAARVVGLEVATNRSLMSDEMS